MMPLKKVEVKGVGGRRRTLLLNNLRNRRIYWELKEVAEDRMNENDRLSIEPKEEIHISRKSMNLLISSMVACLLTYSLYGTTALGEL
jgi:hypothetical protein